MKWVTHRAPGYKLYAVHAFPEEAVMRRLIESLTPSDRPIYWQWVGGMFSLYVVLMVSAVGVYISH